MFIGHYGIAFALKKYASKTSLGILFIAAQLVDIVFFVLVPLGIENLRIIPGFTEASPFDLYNYPITHSLLGALVWAIGTYLVVRFVLLRRSSDTDYSQRIALVLSAAVFSHFLLDLVVHTPDLLLIPGVDISIGLGLWNSIVATVVVELAVLLGGFWIYLTSTYSGATTGGKYGVYVFIIALVVITVFTPFTSYPNELAAASMAEFMYVVFALAAWWIDSKRHATMDQT